MPVPLLPSCSLLQPIAHVCSCLQAICTLKSLLGLTPKEFATCTTLWLSQPLHCVLSSHALCWQLDALVSFLLELQDSHPRRTGKLKAVELIDFLQQHAGPAPAGEASPLRSATSKGSKDQGKQKQAESEDKEVEQVVEVALLDEVEKLASEEDALLLAFFAGECSCLCLALYGGKEGQPKSPLPAITRG